MNSEPQSLFPAESPLLGSPDGTGMERSMFDSAQLLALSTMRALQALTAMQPQADKAEWRKYLKMQQEILGFLHKSAGPDEEASTDSISPERQRELAALIRTRREAAGLHQIDLAKLAGLSRGTIRAIENAEYNPTHTTMLHLLAVKELNLEPSDLPLRSDSRTEGKTAPNWYQSPTYEPLRLFLDLVGQLNSSGGHLEQTYAYIDPMSAANFYSLCNQEKYDAAYRRTMPLDRIAKKLIEITGRAGLDVIALGCGDGRTEVSLVQHLIAGQQQPDLRLYLLDISHYLLSTAYRHAEDTLAGQRGTAVFALQGNFHHLPRYTQLHYRPERTHRRRIVCLLGDTLSNMDNEVQFLRHSLVGFAPGDFLIINGRAAYASADNPTEIRRKDPTIQSGVPPAHAELFGGPIRRYCGDFVDVKFSVDLNTTCPVPGSYSLEVMAKVTLTGKREKQFSVFRFKRYDFGMLKRVLKEIGWDLVAEAPYGQEEPPQMGIMAFVRRAPLLS